VLAVASSAYLSAVYLCGDATRHADAALAERFRTRALAAGLAAGVVAVAGLVVLRFDAERHLQASHAGCGAAGAGRLGHRRRLDASRSSAAAVRAARYTAALAVAATIAGWAVARTRSS